MHFFFVSPFSHLGRRRLLRRLQFDGRGDGHHAHINGRRGGFDGWWDDRLGRHRGGRGGGRGDGGAHDGLGKARV
jgi:hypothetical protein